jgi:hypothetical protein
VPKLADIRLDPKVAFATFQDGLRNALQFPKEEFDRRFSKIQKDRAKDRTQRGKVKRGRKTVHKVPA